MANFFPVILFLGLCISTHVQARESQLFSKFTANSDVKDSKAETTTTRVGPSKEQSEFPDKQAKDLPTFVAEGKNGYGLYGHQTGQLPAADVATTTSFADEPYYSNDKNYNGFYYKDSFAKDEEIARDTKAMLQGSSYSTASLEDDNFGNAVKNSRNNNYFPTKEQQFRNTRQQGVGYTTGVGAAVNGQNNYYAGGNRYTANGGNKIQQQGMSDTRFLEDGKYYHDIDNEEKYNPNLYAESRNAEFDTQGYLPNANRNNNYEYGNRNNNNVNNYNGNYHADNYAAENAKVMSGGYDPVKNQYVFRGTKNDQGFMP